MSYQSFGTVEGILRLNPSHPSVIFIEDLLTGKNVVFIFKKKTYQNLSIRTFGKRVAVSGIVTINEAGEKISVEAQQIEIFPTQAELPTVEDVTGILGGAE